MSVGTASLARMFEKVVEAADRLADAVRECEMPADDDALLAGVRAAVAARNAADGLLARLTGGQLNAGDVAERMVSGAIGAIENTQRLRLR